ncbi:MAG TPA: ABC transporter substrate binding protein, partial [bacterium]|nr:ABC transporter substrate binding protein [bacterium]
SLPDAFSLLATIRGLSNGLEALAVLAPQGQYLPYVRYLEAAGKVTGVKIVLETADSPPDLVSALRGLKGKVQAVWLAPTPMLLDQKNFKFVADFCRNTGVGLFAPVPELAGAGALAGVAPSPVDLGRAAGAAAKDLAAGKSVNKSVNVDQSKVMISVKLAAAMGLKVSARDGLLVP